MNRDNQITAASFEQSRDSKAPPDITTAFRAGFYNGSIWADANRWVSVEKEKPVLGQNINFIVKGGQYEGRTFGGTYQGNKFGDHEAATPGVGFNFQLWSPIPEPPTAEQ